VSTTSLTESQTTTLWRKREGHREYLKENVVELAIGKTSSLSILAFHALSFGNLLETPRGKKVPTGKPAGAAWKKVTSTKKGPKGRRQI